MPEHPSLNLPLLRPRPFTPRRTMEPYAPCWCGSGKKWKWCHKDRERQKPPELHERLAELRAAFARGYCSHPEAGATACSDEIVRAHTVQRRAGLAAIAENGHVISTITAAQDLFKNEGGFVPREIGVRSASAFLGFCSHHDAAMFRPVEVGETVLSTETAFLLSFRAMAYELFMKQAALSTHASERDADKGRPFEVQCAIQEWLHWHETGLRRGLADLERWKAAYDAAYRAKKFDGFGFHGVVFDGILPVVGCGGFHPEFDFAGQPLQRLGRGVDLVYEHVVFNLAVLNGKSVAVIGWNDGTAGPAATFARSFSAVPDDLKAEGAVRLAFEHIENIHIRPSWWYGLSDQQRAAAILRMRTGGPMGPQRQASCLRPDAMHYVGAVGVTETVSTLVGSGS